MYLTYLSSNVLSLPTKQIVSNEETKVDVDKFDYLLRDCKQLNVTTAFDYERVIDNSRVVPVQDGGETRMKIAYRKKISDTLEDLFKGRLRMHQIAYQHRVIKIIEEM
jgi:HD superfamily phosphohydrolase